MRHQFAGMGGWVWGLIGAVAVCGCGGTSDAPHPRIGTRADGETTTTLANVASRPAVSDEAIVWTLDNATTIGGHAAQVLGAPMLTASAAGPALQFNGQSDGLILAVNPIEGWKEFTIEVLIKPDSHGPAEQRFLHVQDQANSRGLLELRMSDAGWSLDAFLLAGQSQRVLADPAKLHPADRWTWVAMSYANGKLTSYIDGKKELGGEMAFAPMGSGAISLGVRQNKISWFKGAIREARFSHVALGEELLRR